ncbi:MAG: hypothetical protein LBH98_03150 [Chitinispirillales bacterium]|nr:hypothetical protein [Chitinispirillales bacterium]
MRFDKELFVSQIKNVKANFDVLRNKLKETLSIPVQADFVGGVQRELLTNAQILRNELDNLRQNLTVTNLHNRPASSAKKAAKAIDYLKENIVIRRLSQTINKNVSEAKFTADVGKKDERDVEMLQTLKQTDFGAAKQEIYNKTDKRRFSFERNIINLKRNITKNAKSSSFLSFLRTAPDEYGSSGFIGIGAAQTGILLAINHITEKNNETVQKIEEKYQNKQSEKYTELVGGQKRDKNQFQIKNDIRVNIDGELRNAVIQTKRAGN